MKIYDESRQVVRIACDHDRCDASIPGGSTGQDPECGWRYTGRVLDDGTIVDHDYCQSHASDHPMPDGSRWPGCCPRQIVDTDGAWIGCMWERGHPRDCEFWRFGEPENLCGMCGKLFRIEDDDPHFATGRGPICPKPTGALDDVRSAEEAIVFAEESAMSQVAIALSAAIESAQISVETIAADAGVPETEIEQMMSADADPTVRALARVGDALGCRVEVRFVMREGR